MTNLQKIEFSNDQVELIKKQIAPNANTTELKLFLYQAQRSGLDPLTRQIYCIHRGGKMTIQTSIDGFRVIAERSGDYGGQDEPIFTEENGKIISCKVAVYRFKGDQRYQAAVGVAYMSEYNAGGPMWAKMPHTMISKCAEALALRKAYPQDLSGLYTTEEMDQSEVEVVEPATPKKLPELTPTHEKWQGAIQALVDGKVTIEKIKQSYFLSAENEALLTNH
jgi:phage recombination protein Bet